MLAFLLCINDREVYQIFILLNQIFKII